MPSAGSLRVEQHAAEWQLVGTDAETFGLINEFLGYLADRAYSPRTVRSVHVSHGYGTMAHMCSREHAAAHATNGTG